MIMVPGADIQLPNVNIKAQGFALQLLGIFSPKRQKLGKKLLFIYESNAKIANSDI